MYAVNKKFPMVIWEDYFTIIETLTNLLIGIGLFSILAGFIFSREYQENTVNSMFTYPISRMQFFVGKLMVMFTLIFITLISSFIVAVFLGLIIRHESLTISILLYHGKTYMLQTIMVMELM